MNLRKIKLDLTVTLLNNPACANAPKLAKDRLQGFKEVGRFLGTSVVKRKAIGKEQIERRYSIKFEHCTLDLLMVSNLKNYSHIVNNFQLIGNVA